MAQAWPGRRSGRRRPRAGKPASGWRPGWRRRWWVRGRGGGGGAYERHVALRVAPGTVRALRRPVRLASRRGPARLVAGVDRGRAQPLGHRRPPGRVGAAADRPDRGADPAPPGDPLAHRHGLVRGRSGQRLVGVPGPGARAGQQRPPAGAGPARGRRRVAVPQRAGGRGLRVRVHHPQPGRRAVGRDRPADPSRVGQRRQRHPRRVRRRARRACSRPRPPANRSPGSASRCAPSPTTAPPAPRGSPTTPAPPHHQRSRRPPRRWRR